ncbi:MAG: SlyX family protein [Pseudomonadota bacterium]
MSSDRIQALEEALAHQEAVSEDLSDVVQKQGEEIALLRREIGKLTRSLEALAADDGAPTDHIQKPPHY